MVHPTCGRRLEVIAAYRSMKTGPDRSRLNSALVDRSTSSLDANVANARTWCEKPPFMNARHQLQPPSRELQPLVDLLEPRLELLARYDFFGQNMGDSRDDDVVESQNAGKTVVGVGGAIDSAGENTPSAANWKRSARDPNCYCVTTWITYWRGISVENQPDTGGAISHGNTSFCACAFLGYKMTCFACRFLSDGYFLSPDLHPLDRLTPVAISTRDRPRIKDR